MHFAAEEVRVSCYTWRKQTAVYYSCLCNHAFPIYHNIRKLRLQSQLTQFSHLHVTHETARDMSGGRHEGHRQAAHYAAFSSGQLQMVAACWKADSKAGLIASQQTPWHCVRYRQLTQSRCADAAVCWLPWSWWHQLQGCLS